MQLSNHYAFRAIDDERAARSHRRNLTEVYLLVDRFDVVLGAWVRFRRKAKFRLERLGVRQLALATFLFGVLRLFDEVLKETELVDARVVLDREVAFERTLQTDEAALGRVYVFLMEVVERIDLNAKEVWVR